LNFKYKVSGGVTTVTIIHEEGDKVGSFSFREGVLPVSKLTI
jgi:hypothetical protein